MFQIGCVESRSPVILQVSGSAGKYANQTFLTYMGMGLLPERRRKKWLSADILGK
jgi:fructose-bisphosphate aldolase class II